MKLAVVKQGTNVVENVIIADDQRDRPPDNTYFVVVLEDEEVSPGWDYTPGQPGTRFTKPAS